MSGKQSRLRMAMFLAAKQPQIAANRAFNLEVNTRQVRRHYARVMAKREAA